MALLACLLVAASAGAQVRQIPGTATSRGGLGTFSPGNSTVSNQGSGAPHNAFGNDSTFADTSATKGLVYAKETPDSVLRRKVFFFHYVPHNVKIDEVWNPTLDPTGAQFSDPLDAFNGNYYLGQGTIGHPHMSLFSTFADGLSYSLQNEGQEGYLKTPESIRLYRR